MTTLTTNCKPLDWMIGKAVEYTRDQCAVVYRFRGTVPARMRQEVEGWLKARNARSCDGGARTALYLTLSDNVDETTRRHQSVSLSFARGCYHSTADSVEVMVTVYDYVLSEEDWAEYQQMQKAA